ncbi:Alpha-glucosidase [Candidatus Sumerlaea chitinivorans]|uniref:Alpha-glucosidase n=1 Tax=Sumerlaea chitinivorans TaxID=2250252 RepID=A0A2Z4Y401_SUMC1|nr:Alpha-glucosidase [Candidatus Sumerlaea chitinivorans]
MNTCYVFATQLIRARRSLQITVAVLLSGWAILSTSLGMGSTLTTTSKIASSIRESQLLTQNEEPEETMPNKPLEIWSAIEDGHRVTLSLADAHTLRLRVGAHGELGKDVSYAVIRKRWPKTDYKLTQETDHVRIETSALEIIVRSQPFALRVHDRKGRVLFQSGKRALSFGSGITVTHKLEQKESIYGMGEVGELFDRRGGKYTLYNTDDFSRNVRQNFYCQIPFAIHLNAAGTRAWGMFIDNPGRQTWDLGFTNPDTASYHLATGDLDLWLWFNGDIRETLRDWVELTGRMERPPLWGLGNQQSRWSYPTEKRVREIAAEFRRRRIPCDVLYLDIDYMNGYRVFTWHPQNFPNPEALLRDLHRDGFRVVTIVDPGVKIDPDYPVYKEFAQQPGFFCMDPATSQPFVGRVWPGETHFPDFTRPNVRERWGELQDQTLVAKGVDGIWNDMNEPHTFDAKEFPGHVLQYDFGRNRPHSEIHQIYGLTMAQASWEGFRRARPDDRPFIITRSGWAGVQRYALMWTGDNQSTWASMILDLQLNLSMGLSGIAFVGCDIGGFAFDCTPELYARWIEWGVFQPFCRTHSAKGTRDQEPWSFGSEVENIARKMIELRMQLLPYLYTVFVTAAETGAPINRPLVYEFPSDTNCRTIADQFLVGDAILVAPVLFSGADRRMVYFPAGKWVHWWTGATFTGPDYQIVEAPLGQPAVFVRAGSVIPMQESQQYVGEKQIHETALEVFPATEIHGLLVEDDGVSRAYLDGKERRTVFEGGMDEKHFRLTLRPEKTGYMPARKQWRIRVHGVSQKPQQVSVDGKSAPVLWHNELCEVVVPDSGKMTTVEIQF